MTNNHDQAPGPAIHGWLTTNDHHELAGHIACLRQYDATSFPPEFAEQFLGLIENVESVITREAALNVVHVDTLGGSRIFAFVGPKDSALEYPVAREHLNTLGDPDFGEDQEADAEENGFIVKLAPNAIGVFDGVNLRGGS